MASLLLDAVGGPAWAFRDVVMFFCALPFLFAGAMILFFRFLDWLSKSKEKKK